MSATPSQENQLNSNSVNTFQAIDKFMQCQEQSYKDFLGQFSHLKKEDVKAMMEKQFKQNRTCLPVKKLHKLKPSNDRELEESDVQNTSEVVTASVSPTNNTEELEEEVLDEGFKSGIMSKGSDFSLQQTATKFDNFVIDAEEISDDDLSDMDNIGYQSSFALANSGPITTTEEKDSVSDGKEEKSLECGTELIDQDIKDDELSENTLNPGEVDPIEEEGNNIPVNHTDRQLDFTAIYRSDDNQYVNQETDNQVCSDEVQPFSLDEDFDYDNVILTPKFSASDLDLMRHLQEEARKLTVDDT